MPTSSAPPPDRDQLAHAIEHARHLLPAQRPLQAFVHHNTLHAFQHHPFEQGVAEAATRLGARAYMSEPAFRAAWSSGRILDRDLDAVLTARVPDEPLGVGLASLSLREVVRRMLLLLPVDASGAALAWRLTETETLRELPPWTPRDAAERLLDTARAEEVLPELFEACRARTWRSSPPRPISRPRDLALRDRQFDPDLLVHPVLIRWSAAWLDQGQSYWSMPDRDQGMYRAVLSLLAQGGMPTRGWMRPLRDRARHLLAAGTGPLDAALEVLHRLGTPRDAVEELITASLLALPGWPGMLVQLAHRPDLAPGVARPAELVEFVALRLLLDEAALAAAPETVAPTPPPDLAGRDAWRLFNLALLVGLRPADLRADAHALDRLVHLLERWHPTAREALWHLAFERRLRMRTVDALLAHQQRTRTLPRTPPRAQVLTCIDDRMESLRRHLEELDPAYETFGWLGFFGVAMAFHGLSEAHPRPLCPPNVRPQHLIEEHPAAEATLDWNRQRGRRVRSGRLGEAASVGSGTLVRGGLLALTGVTTLVPMALRLLSPALHGRLTRDTPQVPTVLALEHDPARPARDGLRLGYTPAEMVDIVRGVLRGAGLVRDHAELVIVLGHGSSSQNNPHEAAYDCGACGGGRGGPNARAFVTMANRPDVRAALRADGIEIPDTTWFVSGLHDTTTDAIDLDDLALVPERLLPTLQTVRDDLDEARRRDAHERCRRFESAPTDLTPLQALRHVEDRAEDLAQPRPECGHATNAICLVGKRAWSRGLYLDRRAFLNSYDSDLDPDGTILESLLATLGPVGAGINLEYYFSYVDPDRYGCGTKLPHNVTGLLGVMDGHGSDLRTGLPWQMVELHEPVRLLLIVEATPERLGQILQRQPALRELVERRWVLVVAFDPRAGQAWFFDEEGFVPHQPEARELRAVPTSADWYRGERGHLPPVTVLAGCADATRGRAA